MENIPEKQEGQVVIEDKLDMGGLAALLSSVIQPLASQDAATKSHAIDADLEKHRITADMNNKASQCGFYLIAALLVIVGGCLGVLLNAGKFELAVNVLWYVAGAASGFGVAASQRTDSKS